MQNTNNIDDDSQVAVIDTAMKTLKEKCDDRLIASVTGLSLDEIAKLKNKI